MQSKTRRFWPAIILLVLITVTFTGCGGDSVEGLTTGVVDLAADVMPRVNLPRITLNYNEAGVPSVFRIQPSSFGLTFLNLPQETVNQLVERNVQHLELEVTSGGLLIYINGQALPYVAWNEDSLAYIGDTVDQLDLMQFDSTIAKAMPLLSKLGIDVVAAFPVPSGVEEIPVRDRSERTLAEEADLGEPTAVLHALIQYDQDGIPSIADITSREIGELAQIDLASVELNSEIMSMVEAAGIQQVAAATASDGLYVLINEQEVLQIAYNEPHLMNAVDAYAQLTGAQDEPLTTLLRNVMPIVYGADIDLVVELPAGQ